MVIATLLLGAAGPNLLVHKQRDAFSHWLAALMLEPPGTTWPPGACLAMVHRNAALLMEQEVDRVLRMFPE